VGFILKPPYKEGKRGKIKNGRDSISSPMILANKKKKKNKEKKKKVNKIKRELNKELKVCLKTTKGSLRSLGFVLHCIGREIKSFKGV
jgi:hypothetical protein